LIIQNQDQIEIEHRHSLLEWLYLSKVAVIDDRRKFAEDQEAS
jgi:hypothetical protein